MGCLSRSLPFAELVSLPVISIHIYTISKPKTVIFSSHTKVSSNITLNRNSNSNNHTSTPECMAPFKVNATAVPQADFNTNIYIKVEPSSNSPQPQNKAIIKSEDDNEEHEVDPSDATSERDTFYQSQVAKLMKMREQRQETDQMFGEVMKGMEENEDKMMDMLNKFNEYSQKLAAEKAAKKAEEKGEGGVKRAIFMILNEKFLTEDGKGAMFQLVMRDDRFGETYLRLPIGGRT